MGKFFVANDKGGVGKSLLAQYCVIALRGANRDPAIVEYDQHPKQCRWFGSGKVRTWPVSPSLLDVQRDSTLAVRFWDPIFNSLTDDRDLVVDLGAQAWSGFHQWSKASGLEQFCPTLELVVLVPFTADSEAVRGALRVVGDTLADLPRARVVLMRLDRDGDVDMLRGTPELEELWTAARHERVSLRVFPVLRAEGFPLLSARGFRLDQIATMKPGEVNFEGLSGIALARTVAAVRAWMTEMYRSLLPVILKVGSPSVGVPTGLRPETTAPVVSGAGRLDGL